MHCIMNMYYVVANIGFDTAEDEPCKVILLYFLTFQLLEHKMIPHIWGPYLTA